MRERETFTRVHWHQSDSDQVPAGYESLASHLSLLLKTYPPPFIYIKDSENPRLAGTAAKSTIRSLSQHAQSDASLPVAATACIDAIACFTPRLFYDTVLNALADWHPRWEEGCENWVGSSGVVGQRWNDSLDGFIHGLQVVCKHIGVSHRTTAPRTSNKGKTRQYDEDDDEPSKRIILVVERADRLRAFVPDLFVPLTRLAELVSANITSLFASDSILGIDRL